MKKDSYVKLAKETSIPWDTIKY